MAFPITKRARAESEETNLTPSLVLKIDGIEECYGAVLIKKFVRIGDPELIIGQFDIGGLAEVENQSEYISFQKGTSTTIRQTLNVDKGKGESVSSMNVAIVDKNAEITRDLLTPGAIVPDIMGRKCKLYLGFEDSAFPEDYIVIFRGIISGADSSAGLVTLKLLAAEEKKRSEIYILASSELTSDVSPGDTVINVDDTSDFLTKITGPDGTIDSAFKTGIKINDEIIEYEIIAGSQFQSIARGSLSTIPASHATGDTVESFYRISASNVLDIALKLLFSGKNGNYLEDLSVSNFVRISPTETLSNTIFFKSSDIIFEHNMSLGDFVTTTGAINGSNNVSLKPIIGIDNQGFGTILTIGDVSFVEENDSTGLISFRSQFDVWPDGLSMDGDEVDVDEHKLIKQRFLSTPEMEFYLKDTINGKEFIAEQVYNPVAAYSLPRKSQASLGFHSPPIPGTDIKILSSDNVKNASKLKLSRTTTKNFFNSIIYKYNEDVLSEDFLSGTITLDATSLSRIPVGNKPLQIEARGLRTLLSAENIANQATSRRLKKYKFAAEFVKGLKLNYKTGWNLEIGDIVVFDMSSLQVSDIESGTRSGESRLFQIDNKTLNIKTGEITLDIVDTNFNKDARFGLISPSSFIGPDATTISFNLKPSFNTDRFGINEGKKWEKYVGAQINVRSSDFSVQETGIIKNVIGNKIFLESPLAFVPTEDYLFELGKYTGQPDTIKLIFVFMSDVTFPDGGVQYAMI